MDEIAELLGGPLGANLDRPLLNRTGLGGRFSYELTFSRQAGRLTTSGPVPAGAPFDTALREQLGLELASTRGPVEVLVIDSVQDLIAN